MNEVPGGRGRAVFLAWAFTDVVSVLGSRITTLAIPWFVLTSTGSPVKTGLVAAAELAPMVALKALAGPALDRVGPARAGARLDVAAAAVAAGIPVLWATGLLSFPVLLVLVALLGALRGPSDSAKGALVPAVAEAAAQPLERVTGVAGTTERLATTLGVAAAGVLIAAVGASNAILVTAAGFLVSACLLGVVIAPRVPMPPLADEGTKESYGAQLAQGWRFIRNEPVLLAIAGIAAVTNMFDQAWFAVLVPLWARQTHRGADAVGLVLAVMSACAVGGALFAAVLGSRFRRLPLYAGGYLLVGLPRYLVLAMDVSLPVVIGVFAVAGLAGGLLNPIISAVQFERIPRDLVGRVSSLTTAAAWCLMPLGGILGGLLCHSIGLSLTLIVLGAGYLITTLAPLAMKSFRAMERTPAPA